MSRQQGVPRLLLTDNEGPNQRLRVDVAQTGFFAGREFRTYKEWTAPTTGTYVVKIVSPVDYILFELLADIEDGSLRCETVLGGTEGGSFSENFLIIGTNNMSSRPTPFYTPQLVATAGGTLTGGLTVDVFRIKTSGNTVKASSVGGGASAERGIPAGTSYLRFTLSGVVGLMAARWEERL